jgi:DNA-binding response OmpR family regulator
MRIAFLCERGSVADHRSTELEARGHIVHRYRNELDLLRDVVRESFDVLLLDDTLRGLRCRSLVQRLKAFPRFDGAVVFVNCDDDEVRLAEALAAGADDFVGRSAGVRELEARLRAILRRRFMRLHTTPEGLQFGAYRFDPDGRLAYLDGLPIGLTRKEYELALFLFANEGRLVSRGHLLDMVWRRRASAESRTLDSHVSRVRRNLLLDRRRGFELVAVYGSGYRLDRCAEGVPAPSPARASQCSEPSGLCAGA